MSEYTRDTIKGIAGAVLFWAAILGFAWFVTHYHYRRQALCPGYSVYEACAAMGE
jgi:hypothetical protein